MDTEAPLRCGCHQPELPAAAQLRRVGVGTHAPSVWKGGRAGCSRAAGIVRKVSFCQQYVLVVIPPSELSLGLAACHLPQGESLCYPKCYHLQ